MNKTFLKNILIFTTSIVFALFIGEGLIRTFMPQILMTPRFDFREDIGLINFSDVVMEHRIPGQETLYYTVNQERYRGEVITPEFNGDKIVVLGDSFTFGIGVQDDETYSHVLDQNLKGKMKVVNLGNSGWGLTHQINRYLTYGKKLKPKMVVLQFAANDPKDSILTPSIIWDSQKNEFKFQKVEQQNLNFFRRAVSYFKPVYKLLTGHSHLYNYLRHPLYSSFVKKDRSRNNPNKLSETEDKTDNMPFYRSRSSEEFYMRLLTNFAKYLKAQNTPLVMISVQAPGGTQLDLFPSIKQRVLELEAQELLTYLRTDRWMSFESIKKNGWRSPEGHLWGAVPHKVIGESLSQWILRGEGAVASSMSGE